MLLEGEVNWILVLGVAAALAAALAVLGLFSAARFALAYRNATARLEMAQAGLEGSDRRLREVLDAIPVALVETDAAGKFVFANRAANQLLGRRDAELLGLRFHSATWGVTYPDGRPIPPDLLPSARALRGQTVRGFQHIMANPATRKKMLVSVTAMPITNRLGGVIGSTAAIVETDSLIQPEPAPEPASTPEAVMSDAAGGALVRRVFDAASSALVVVDAHGHVREANRAALDLCGREADGVRGADFADLFLNADERALGRQALRAARAAGPGAAEPLVSPGAGVRWRLLPLADGDDQALLLAGERLAPEPEGDPAPRPDDPVQALHAELETARRRLEETEARAAQDRAELQAARRLEDVGRLTGGVAHDFSALLGVMTSALDMLLKQADRPERVRRLGAAALAAGRRGETLTQRLSAFSQGRDATASRLDLTVLLRGLEPTLRAAAGPEVDLMIETPPGPVEAVIDPVAFDDALKALADNAVQAVGGRGSVAVRLEALEDGGARLSVRDDGPGMDADTLARASEPFFTTRDGAAGLGLSRAYAFARQSGGRLTLDSAPGEGAEAAVTLPAPSPETGPAPDAQAQADPEPAPAES